MKPALLDSPPAVEPRLYRHALGHQQVNDAWLVELAAQRGGELVTFDARLKVHDSTNAVVVVIR